MKQDSPLIPIVGGKYDGKAINDPDIIIGEEDVVRIMANDSPADDVFYVINIDSHAVPTSGRKRRTGKAFEFHASELVKP